VESFGRFGKLKFPNYTTQGDDTAGITNCEESGTTDFDQEFNNIFRVLIGANDIDQKKNGLDTPDQSDIDIIQKMIKRKDSIHDLLNESGI